MYDDVGAALDMVASHEFALGIVTNVAADHQRRKLALVGLGDRFGIVVGASTRWASASPTRRVFRHA